jgi:hypothetical protein
MTSCCRRDGSPDADHRSVDGGAGIEPARVPHRAPGTGDGGTRCGECSTGNSPTSSLGRVRTEGPQSNRVTSLHVDCHPVTRSEREHWIERVVDAAVDGLASGKEGWWHGPRRWRRCGLRRRRRGRVRWQLWGQAGRRTHRRWNLGAVRGAHPPCVVRLLIADGISVPGFTLPRIVGMGWARHGKRHSRRGGHNGECRKPHLVLTRSP